MQLPTTQDAFAQQAQYTKPITSNTMKSVDVWKYPTSASFEDELPMSCKELCVLLPAADDLIRGIGLRLDGEKSP